MKSKESWKPVVGYRGYYEVSNLGNIQSINRVVKGRRLNGRPLSQTAHCRSAHLYVSLCFMGRQTKKYVHCLVLEAWVGLRFRGQECRHLDGDPSNNIMSNLKWGTRSDNLFDRVKHGTHGSRLLRKNILRSDGRIFIGLSHAADVSNCFKTNISSVCRGKRKSAGGFGWSFI